MSKPLVLSTRVLMICAAVGVAIGLISIPWAGLHAAASAAVPALYGLVLGFHILPGVVAQQILRLPWVALITHAIAALVATSFSPAMGKSYLMAAIIFGGTQELISAITRYRHWEAWRFLLGGLITGALLALVMWLVRDISTFTVLQRILFVACYTLGPVIWTVVGLGIGSALRRAGVAPPKTTSAQKTS